MDAVGAAANVQQALAALRPRGRHVQPGLLPGEVRLDVSALIAVSCAGWAARLAAHAYPELQELAAPAGSGPRTRSRT